MALWLFAQQVKVKWKIQTRTSALLQLGIDAHSGLFPSLQDKHKQTHVNHTLVYAHSCKCALLLPDSTLHSQPALDRVSADARQSWRFGSSCIRTSVFRMLTWYDIFFLLVGGGSIFSDGNLHFRAPYFWSFQLLSTCPENRVCPTPGDRSCPACSCPLAVNVVQLSARDALS